MARRVRGKKRERGVRGSNASDGSSAERASVSRKRPRPRLEADYEAERAEAAQARDALRGFEEEIRALRHDESRDYHAEEEEEEEEQEEEEAAADAAESSSSTTSDEDALVDEDSEDDEEGEARELPDFSRQNVRSAERSKTAAHRAKIANKLRLAENREMRKLLFGVDDDDDDDDEEGEDAGTDLDACLRVVRRASARLRGERGYELKEGLTDPLVLFTQ